MSEYNESSISRTSSNALKAKKIQSKPGSLPWEEESMTFSRDQGVVLVRLQRENTELRKKLKEFNANINDIISRFKGKKPTKKTLESKPENILDNTKKKLEYYEKEYKRLENRIYRLSDFGYEVSLKNAISASGQKVLELENSIKKYEAGQKLRSKELGGVLETGEKVELYKEFFEINKEITIYSQKIVKIEELGRLNKKNVEETERKIKELEKNIDKGDLTEIEKVVNEGSRVKEMMERMKRGEKMVEGKYKSGLKILENKVKKLTEDLAKSKSEEEELSKKLEVKMKEYQEKQLDLGDLQIKATVFSNRRGNSYSDDYMFLTEKIV